MSDTNQISLVIVTLDFKINIRTDLLCLAQNDTLVLCALESNRDSNIISQAKALEVI